MKINRNFVLRQLADTWVVLPLAEKTIDFNGMITLNESGVLLWKALENDTAPEQLAAVLRTQYDVSEQQALEDVKAFVDKLRSVGCLDEE